MPAINTSSASSYDDNLSTGHKVVTYAIRLLAWGAALSVAFSCSSIIMGIIMFIIMSLFMALLSIAAHIYITFKVEADSIESVGRVLNNTTARVAPLFTRVSSLFTREAKPSAKEAEYAAHCERMDKHHDWKKAA